jgi:hypothetical protein
MRRVPGVRIELALESESAEEVAYRVRVDGAAAGRGVVRRADGEVGFAWEGDAPAQGRVRLIRALLRTLWNGRRGAGGPAWPRRVTRWRPD